MPVKIRKLKGGKYRVSTPSGVKAKSTTLTKAKKLKSILDRFDKKKK